MMKNFIPMLAMQPIKKEKKRKRIPDQLYDLNDLPESLLSQKRFQTKKISGKFQITKRLSPFLIAAIFLPVLIIYSIISTTGNSVDIWFLLFLFVFTQVNLLMMDFAIWNYYNGKKRFKIWVIESCIILITLYFIF
jgi:hypothetical protein